MPRGLWRWWQEQDGQEAWFARVEHEPGAWIDVSQQDYSRQQCEPSFWDLPLKNQHLERVIHLSGDEADSASAKFGRAFVIPGIIALILAFCVLFVVGVVCVAALAKLNLLR